MQRDNLQEQLQLWNTAPSKKGAKAGNKALRLLLELKYNALANSAQSKRRAESLFAELMSEPTVLAIAQEAGADWSALLAAFWLENCLILLHSCHDDDSYGRKFFQLIKLSEVELAHKTGQDCYGVLIKLLLTFSPELARDLLICSLHQAYTIVFGAQSQVFTNFLSEEYAGQLSQILSSNH